MDKFEKTIAVIITVLVIFLAFAQFDMKKEHNEQAMKRQLAYKEFLDGGKRPGEWTIAYKENR